MFGTGTAADRRVVSGPSGAAGLAGLIAAAITFGIAAVLGLLAKQELEKLK